MKLNLTNPNMLNRLMAVGAEASAYRDSATRDLVVDVVRAIKTTKAHPGEVLAKVSTLIEDNKESIFAALAAGLAFFIEAAAKVAEEARLADGETQDERQVRVGRQVAEALASGNVTRVKLSEDLRTAKKGSPISLGAVDNSVSREVNRELKEYPWKIGTGEDVFYRYLITIRDAFDRGDVFIARLTIKDMLESTCVPAAAWADTVSSDYGLS